MKERLEQWDQRLERHRLYRFARTLLGRGDEAEDVVHDVLERLWRRHESLHVENPEAFAMTAVRNAAIDHLRRSRTTEELPLSLPADPVLVHRGWTDGDLNYNPAGGWLAIFFDDERNSMRYGDQLTIGRVEGSLEPLRALEGRLDALIETDERRAIPETD